MSGDRMATGLPLVPPKSDGVRVACRRRAKPDIANKALRAVWNLAWLVFFRPSPRPFHGWRRLVLRVFGARIGAGAMPYPGARIWAPWNLVMEDGSVMGDGVDCYSVDRIILKRGAVVSQRSFLCSASHDFDRPGLVLTSAPIVIAEDAWVAAESFVGPGVTVGRGAVVLARAVAVRSIPPMAVAAGNPARVIRSRSEAAFDAAVEARATGRKRSGIPR